MLNATVLPCSPISYCCLESSSIKTWALFKAAFTPREISYYQKYSRPVFNFLFDLLLSGTVKSLLIQSITLSCNPNYSPLIRNRWPLVGLEQVATAKRHSSLCALLVTSDQKLFGERHNHSEVPNMSLKSRAIQHSEFTTPPRTPVACDKFSITLDTYVFPHSKLRREMKDSMRTPLCLVSCGSFSPPTFLHLRMFDIAADYVRDNTDFEVIGGYLSPVSSAYKREELVGANLRVKMCS